MSSSETRSHSLGLEENPIVLVVEDEIVLRYLAADNLTDLGFTVVAAANGMEAIAILKSQPVDIVFTDVKMPGEVDGLGLAHWIDGNLPGLPVLLTSGSLCDLPPGVRGPDRRLVQKPYRLAEVTGWIKVMLQGSGAGQYGRDFSRNPFRFFHRRETA